MSTSLWLNPVFGVSGDMLLGALVGVGADFDHVRQQVDKVGIDGWSMEVSVVSRRGIRATRVTVEAERQEHRAWTEIDAMLAESELSRPVADGARRTFEMLAQVEAAQHGVSIDEVRFHEVGAVDAIVDIVGGWAALSSLDVGSVASGPVGLGAGSVVAAHGAIPHPAPAVTALLKGLPVVAVDSRAETATPTGVALLATMVDRWEGIPTGTVTTTGLGAGGRDPESHANVLSAVLVKGVDYVTTNAVVLETNLDDVTPETLAYVVECLLAAGADDAWTVPIVMKKGRSGHMLAALCAPAKAAELVEVIARETGTLGVRTRPVDKTVFPRAIGSVDVDGHEIAIKAGPYGAKPEFEDLKRAAHASGRPLAELREDALARWKAASLV